MTILFSVNGRGVALELEGSEPLADLLRDRLGLYGTRLGCLEGVCGTCTVLLGGAPVRACPVLAGHAHGSGISIVGVAPTRLPMTAERVLNALDTRASVAQPA